MIGNMNSSREWQKGIYKVRRRQGVAEGGWLGWLGALALLAASAAADEAVFLALQGDGAASLVIDERNARAFVIDGGSSGVGGIAGSLVGESDPLGHMLDRGIRELFVICSHPHRDHMSGLIRMVEDDRLTRFERVVFVDNDFERRTGKPSLLAHYRSAGGGGAGGPEAGYLAVEGPTPIAPAGSGGVAVELYGGTVGTSEHDRAIVTTYTIEDGERSNTVVDFDDASKELVEHWSRVTTAEPNTLVVSHHGSKYNYSAEVLNAHPSIRAAIIAVNDNNRYMHPAPEVLSHLVEKLGPDRVFVTRSEPGSNVVATAEGVTAAEENRVRLAGFVGLQIERHVTRVEALHELGDATLDPAAGDRLGSGDSSLRLVGELEEQGKLTARQAAMYRNSVTAVVALGAVQRLVLGGDDPGTGGMPGYRYVSVGKLGPETSNGTAEFAELHRDLQEAEKRGEGRPGSPLRATPSKAYAGGIEKAGRMFRTAITLPVPTFGGIIVGNGSLTPTPREIGFAMRQGAEGDWEVWIEIRLADGRLASYVDLTPGELWSAYNFVQPERELVEKHPDLLGNSAGLVGLDSGGSTSWKFAIHPAIADTVLAVPAMQVDMFLAANKQPEGVPSFESALTAEGRKLLRWQWFDAPAAFEVQGQRLLVRSSVEPAHCLMRVRLVEVPPWANWYDNDMGVEREVQRRMRLVGQADRIRKELRSEDIREPAEASRATRSPESLASVWRRLQEQAVRKQVVEERVLTFDMDRMTSYIGQICGTYRPLRKIDRLARVIALLNWYRGADERRLPPLPEGVEPARRQTPNQYSFEDLR